MKAARSMAQLGEASGLSRDDASGRTHVFAGRPLRGCVCQFTRTNRGQIAMHHHSPNYLLRSDGEPARRRLKNYPGVRRGF